MWPAIPIPDNASWPGNMTSMKLDRAYVGSCTGGKTSDFVEFARVLRGKKVVIDTFGVPATPEIVHDLQTARWGDRTIWQILTDAGVQMTENAGCAACLGGPVDTFGRMNAPLKCISATNRNFPGRMGHKESQVFLASPATVAASALDRPYHRPAGVSELIPDFVCCSTGQGGGGRRKAGSRAA